MTQTLKCSNYHKPCFLTQVIGNYHTPPVFRTLEFCHPHVLGSVVHPDVPSPSVCVVQEDLFSCQAGASQDHRGLEGTVPTSDGATTTRRVIGGK